ncbi:hypothetical protein [uncultured Mailhella sp.]|uniref:hypothetical protein n=1 Tax=uncultured Mailhella sp. TaxID=1981031 RepID=UPI0025F19B78|nr:hypothetical protein [uncultured Mailhella sp.]
MNILVVSGRSDLWQTLRPQFEKRGASMSAAPTLDDALAAMQKEQPVLVVLDLDMNRDELRSAVFWILSVSAMIHTAAVSSMSPEAFHDAMEGLGMLASLPTSPTPADIDALMDALARVTG